METILTLPSSISFAACTTISTIGLYLSYMFPILIMVIRGKEFKKGPFDLGRFSRPCGIVASMWIMFTTVAFCLPAQNEVNEYTVNYTPVAVGIVTIYCILSWYLWAKNWCVFSLSTVILLTNFIPTSKVHWTQKGSSRYSRTRWGFFGWRQEGGRRLYSTSVGGIFGVHIYIFCNCTGNFL